MDAREIVLARGPALLRGNQHGATIAFDAAPAGAADRPVIDALVTKMFSLDLDVAPFWRRARREPGFAELVRRCAGLRPQRFRTLFEALANGLCCQQFSLASGMTRLGHLAERFGLRTPDGTRVGPSEPGLVARTKLSAIRQAGLNRRTDRRPLRAAARDALLLHARLSARRALISAAMNCET